VADEQSKTPSSMAKAHKDWLPVGLLISRASMQAAFQTEDEVIQNDSSGDGKEIQKEMWPEPIDVGIDTARLGNECFLRGLLETGWSESTQDKYGGTALHWAAGGGHLDCCKVLNHRETGDSIRIRSKLISVNSTGSFFSPGVPILIRG
jgi:ankyrin repeat protein